MAAILEHKVGKVVARRLRSTCHLVNVLPPSDLTGPYAALRIPFISVHLGSGMASKPVERLNVFDTAIVAV